MKINQVFNLLFLLFLPLSNMLAQEKFTVSGYVKDVKNGEAIIGAVVKKDGANIGTYSNDYGFYSLTLPKGSHKLVFTYLGFVTVSKDINLEKNTTLNIELKEEGPEDGKMTEEVVITGVKEDANVKSQEMSVNKLDIKTISKIPALLGEVDVIRAIQLLPGVSTVGEGATGFNVRGGNVDQNLVLLDEAPVFNSSHLFGMFSVFNPDAVKDVKLIKGGIPSQYGGRASSILDIRMKEGNNKKLGLKGGVGTIFSRLAIEAPFVKDRGSFIIAARRSYIDVLAKPFLKGDLKGAKFYFYDLTAKINYRINEKNTVFLSGYFGRDVFGAGFKFNWGNTTTTARWNHLFNEKLFFNLTAFYSNYDYVLGFKDEDSDQAFDWNAKIKNYSPKLDFTWYASPKHTLRFGAQAIYYDFQPGNAVVTGQNFSTDITLKHKFALESAFYIDDEWKISDKFSAQGGVRFSMFDYLGTGISYLYNNPEAGIRRDTIGTQTFGNFKSIKRYMNIEPRFSFKWQTDSISSVKLSYNRLPQYLMLVSNTIAASPLDIWTPATNNIKPLIADQIAIGYFRNFRKNMFETSIEIYYKQLQNVLDYIPNADLLLNELYEGDLLQGQGRAYGMELYFRKTKGKLTGWVSYTLSRTESKIDGISKNEWFLNRYDRMHNMNTVVTYELNKKWSFSANFVFQTGTPATYPDNKIMVQGYPIPYNSSEKRNNFRIPPYHRLDISATFEPKKNADRRWQSSWVFSVYNVYNRKNPYSVFFRIKEGESQNTEAIRYSIIGSFVPAVTYNFEF